MKKIGLLSDTHGYMDERIQHFLADRDEIWHAGDWGSINVSDTLTKIAPVKGVYGNIDGTEIRLSYPEKTLITMEGMKILIIHIGGTPGKYFPNVRSAILEHKPDIFICGHSHILRIERDKTFNMLYMNPGAAGKHGFHKVRTLLLFELNAGKIENLRAVELGPRSRLEEE